MLLFEVLNPEKGSNNDDFICLKLTVIFSSMAKAPLLKNKPN